MTSVCYADVDRWWDTDTRIDDQYEQNQIEEDQRINRVLKEIYNSLVQSGADIAESRKREDLLNQEVHLLQYQIDVLTNKDAK